MPREFFRILLLAFLVLILATARGQRIKALVTGKVDAETNPLIKWFEQEPSVDATAVITRPSGLIKTRDIQRFVRLYFPRNYQQLKEYEFILLHSPEMYHLTREQDRWMHDAILEGSGGLAAPAGLSDHVDIQNAWINSMVQKALPNDFESVIASGGRRGQTPFHIEVNRDFPEPVLTPFVPLGIESFPGAGGNMIIGREGSAILAWQIGDSLGRVPYMIAWDYGQGRGMTLADSLHLTFWSDYISLSNPAYDASQNPYGLDILMNMVLYLTRRDLPTEVLVLHKIRNSFVKYRTQMSLLVSLADFAQKFGADSSQMWDLVSPISDKAERAEEMYMEQDFQGCQQLMDSIFDDLSQAELRVISMKERALMWVYVAEGLTITAVFMVSSFVLWTVMVRRRLYRTVGASQLERREGK